MFSLDQFKNGTSASLDLLRAVAAQMVCVGHAINFGGLGSTSAPSIGVLLFFILSGFVIAHTLKTKADSGPYSLGQYAVERTARIYCAYLPAMLLIGIAHLFLTFSPSDPTDFRTFLANVFLLQGWSMFGSHGTFGVAGQMTSIAQEFHIYFFVGGLFFLCIGRQRFAAAIVTVLFASMPLANFLSLQGRALFLIWLIGFAIYFVVRSIEVDRTFVLLFCAVTVGAVYFWLPFWNQKDVYDIANFPAVAILFACLVVVTQRTTVFSTTGGIIHFFAGYSLTLFLTHLVLIRTLYLIWPEHGWLGLVFGVIGANAFAAAFAQFTELKYKRISAFVMSLSAPAPFDRFRCNGGA